MTARRALVLLLGCLSAAPGAGIELFPVGDPYSRSLADPHAPANSVRIVRFHDVDIEDSGKPRFLLQAGGRFPVLGGDRGLAGGERWRLSIEAGFDGVFDIDRSFDAIGWDGNYGLVASAGLGRGAAKLGILHTSSHVGDEYAERTGRQRLDYTRQELLAALSWPLPPSAAPRQTAARCSLAPRASARRLRVYGEAGWGLDLRNEAVQDPWRGQAGVEWQSGARWRDRFGLYGALDLQAMQERDWDIETSLQIGFIAITGDRRWRVGLEYLDGRPPLGEFYQHDERGVGIGLWVDV